MKNEEIDTGHLLGELQALAETAFPKTCLACGRRFETAEEYWSDTVANDLNKRNSGEAQKEDGGLLVELFRNCPCGSPLQDYFSDRRDHSNAGIERRKRFGKSLSYLVSIGLEPPIARMELMKILRREHSDLLDSIVPARSKQYG